MPMTSFYCAASAYLELVHYAGLVHISESVYSYSLRYSNVGLSHSAFIVAAHLEQKVPGTNQQLQLQTPQE